MWEDFKEVTQEEFQKFLQNYDNFLIPDVNGIREPPMVSYNDFEGSKTWPQSVVAYFDDHAVYGDPYNNPRKYYIRKDT